MWEKPANTACFAFRPEKRAVGRRAFQPCQTTEGDGVAGARTWILDQLDAERSRWMLRLPVAMGLGIAIYFELPSEPALWLGPVLAAAALVVVFLARSGSLARALAIGAVAAACGLGLVAWRTASLAAPTLSLLPCAAHAASTEGPDII